MFGWIRRMWDAASGAVDNTVRSWVHDLINGLYGFLHLIFGKVGSAWDSLAATITNNWHRIEEFAKSVSLAFYHVLKVAIPAAIADARKLFAQVEAYAKSIYDYVVRQIDAVTRLITSSIDALWRQVVKDVWDPLSSSLTSAWKWINQEGVMVLFYITHPGKLIDLVWTALLAKLESEAWTAGDLLGKFFLALILNNLTRFVALIEDIIDAVL